MIGNDPTRTLGQHLVVGGPGRAVRETSEPEYGRLVQVHLGSLGVVRARVGFLCERASKQGHNRRLDLLPKSFVVEPIQIVFV